MNRFSRSTKTIETKCPPPEKLVSGRRKTSCRLVRDAITTRWYVYVPGGVLGLHFFFILERFRVHVSCSSSLSSYVFARLQIKLIWSVELCRPRVFQATRPRTMSALGESRKICFYSRPLLVSFVNSTSSIRRATRDCGDGAGRPRSNHHAFAIRIRLVNNVAKVWKK